MEQIIKAQKEGLISFEHLSFVDPHPNPHALKIWGDQAVFVKKTYHDFSADILTDKMDLSDSILVPDHTAPHVLLQTFVQLLKAQTGKQVTLVPFDENLNLPFQKNLDSGISALSFATWICPLECEEPDHCPGCEQQRTWDFSDTLGQFKIQNQSAGHSVHLFGCTQMAYGVCEISLKTIAEEWAFLRQKINDIPHRFTVATFSKCHGIIGTASINE